MTKNHRTVIFAGQSTGYRDELRYLVNNQEIASLFKKIEKALIDELNNPEIIKTGLLNEGIYPWSWSTGKIDFPEEEYLSSSAVSQTMLFLVSMGQAINKGLFPEDNNGIISYSGHSQGIFASAIVSQGKEKFLENCEKASRYLIWQGIRMQQAAGLSRRDLNWEGLKLAPMVSVWGFDEGLLYEIQEKIPAEKKVYRSLKNAPDRFVFSGKTDDIKYFLNQLTKFRSSDHSRRNIPFDVEPLNVSGPFHCPIMLPARKMAGEDIKRVGLRFKGKNCKAPCYSAHDGTKLDSEEDFTNALLDSQFQLTVDYPLVLEKILGDKEKPDELIIPGPGDGLLKLTSVLLRGNEVSVSSTIHESEGDKHQVLNKNILDSIPSLKNGKLHNRFTRYTGNNPVILAGMTPTTATADIVAAAANGNFVSELAGGGQVTAEIFQQRMDELQKKLAPGKEIVLNTLYLDPYLYGLHLQKEGMLFKLKKQGMPLCGLTLSAGVPDVEEAGQLLNKLYSHDIWLNSFKSGTPNQIEKVLKIAAANSNKTFIIQVEGGEGGGHHSWYPLENLLYRYYSKIRKHDNLLLAVGGGIATKEDAKKYLLGTWYGGPGRRPVDAVLTGTAAMVSKEAETNTEIKKKIAATAGIDNGWVQYGKLKGGFRSGRSSLGATIWYMDNVASSLAYTADEVEKNPVYAKTRKKELIERLNKTWKPYFGDFKKMNYRRLLERFVELTAIGQNRPYENGVWLSKDHPLRLQKLVIRICQRFQCVPPDFDKLQQPQLLLKALFEKLPELEEYIIKPTFGDYFMKICRLPGKPLPFVPVIDEKFRQRYLADSLFLSHDPKMKFDQVLVIPGPKSTSKIKNINQPVAELLGEIVDFEFNNQASSNTISPRNFKIKRKTTFKEFSEYIADYNLKSLAEALRFQHETGTMPNPLHSLFIFEKGDRVDLKENSLSWYQKEKLKGQISTKSEKTIVKYTVALPDNNRKTLILNLENCAGGYLYKLKKEELKESLNKLYQDNIFNDSARMDEYQLAMKRSPDFKNHVSLPWLASKALKTMVENLDADPTGMLHYQSKVRLLPGFNKKSLNPDNIENAVSASTETSVRVDLKTGEEKIGEVEGVFIPEKKKIDFGESLPPSKYAKSDDFFDDELHLGSLHFNAPENSSTFALVSGDMNPLHLDEGFARFSGLPGTIIHGLWSQAKALSLFEKTVSNSSQLKAVELSTKFISPVFPGEKLKMSIIRKGRSCGNYIHNLQLYDSERQIKMETVVKSTPFKTAYLCPGQGVQKVKMHESSYSNSESARKIWEKADRITTESLGFSLLEILENNPSEITIDGVKYSHPEGVLNLTQFTQVSLVVLACAQIAELKENGAFIPDAAFSGHSLGEYSSLSAIGNILSLEKVVEVVYHRGLTMQNFVPRDEKGNSPFRLGVIRPHHANLNEKEMFAIVEEISTEKDSYIEIVNYNCRGRQYAVTGYTKGLNKLKNKLGAGIRGKSPYLEVPGIDVPFHSSLLRDGVEAFRKTLTELFPNKINPEKLVDKYWPNLTGIPFSLELEYAEEVYRITSSPVVKELIDNHDQFDQKEYTSRLTIELLAYQFASPVQWIKIQEGLLQNNYQNLVEIGPGHQPTLTNLMGQTLAFGDFSQTTKILHLENDRNTIYGKNLENNYFDLEFIKNFTDPDNSSAVDDSTLQQIEENTAINSEVKQQSLQKESAIQQTRSSFPGTTLSGAQGCLMPLKSLLSVLAGVWPEEIDNKSSIDELLQGNSARRNQFLSEIKKEFNLENTDGFSEMKLDELAINIEDTSKNYQCPGNVLKDSINGLLDALNLKTVNEFKSEVTDKYNLDNSGFNHFLTALLPYQFDYKSKLTGATNPLGLPASDKNKGMKIIEKSLLNGMGLEGEAEKKSSAMSAGTMVDSATLNKIENRIFGDNGLLAKVGDTLDSFRNNQKEENVDLKNIDSSKKPIIYEHYDQSVFEQEKIVELSSWKNWIREDALALINILMAGKIPEKELLERIERRGDKLALPLLKATLEEIRDTKSTSILENTINRLEKQKLNQLPEKIIRLVDLKVDKEPNKITLVQEKDFDLGDCTIVVTGAGPNSIAESGIKLLLSGGAKVMVGVSNLSYRRIKRMAGIYRNWANKGAVLEIVPFRQGNYQDIDLFANYISSNISRKNLLLWPFAAYGVNGMIQDLEFRHENALRVNLLGVEKLLSTLAMKMKAAGWKNRLQVFLPLSPNLGEMGGDGVYAESKAALEVLMNKWYAEPLLKEMTAITGVKIGWVRGTGLMKEQDKLAPELEKLHGIKTFSSTEMGEALCWLANSSSLKTATGENPVLADITGGLGGIQNWGNDVKKLRQSMLKEMELPTSLHNNNKNDASIPELIKADKLEDFVPFGQDTDFKLNPNILENEIVVVGYGEIGPFGNEETRWGYEKEGAFLNGAALKLALFMNLVKYDPQEAGFRLKDDGKLVKEKEIENILADHFQNNTGIRERKESGPDKNGYSTFSMIKLNSPMEFVLEDRKKVIDLKTEDPQNTKVAEIEPGKWKITKLAGSKLYLPYEEKYKNSVAGMVPDGWNPVEEGLNEMETEDRDRNTIFMLYAVSRALLKAGISSEEIRKNFAPGRIGNTIGTGIGGMERLIRLYTDPVFGKKRDPVTLQESLGNVGAGHISQEILGNYGSMLSPVAACATAGISVEAAVEKIQLNKADLMIAGASDDISYAGTIGFDDMGATVDYEEMKKRGIPAENMSRPHDTRRKGFIEAQGGGAALLTKAITALEKNLPVYGIIGGCWSFADGISQSIPAPGYGPLVVARGKDNSQLSRALSKFQLDINDIGFVSMHGTSTTVNDPHESKLYDRILDYLGRDVNKPVYVVSQKGITGHPKGGAASFQLNGALQIFKDGIIPGHLNLDDLDPEVRSLQHLVYPSRKIEVGRNRLKAALITT
ncbi:MAG: fatty acid synthase subunit beta domain-containing protein, partial [Myxococcota bacterium]